MRGHGIAQVEAYDLDPPYFRCTLDQPGFRQARDRFPGQDRWVMFITASHLDQSTVSRLFAQPGRRSMVEDHLVARQLLSRAINALPIDPAPTLQHHQDKINWQSLQRRHARGAL